PGSGRRRAGPRRRRPCGRVVASDKEVVGVLIGHILSRKGDHVVTVRPDASIADALEQLREHNIGALVVRDDAAGAPLLGVLSERDVVRALTTLGATTLDQQVADLMTADPTTCTPRGTVEE